MVETSRGVSIASPTSKVDFSNPDGCWPWAGSRRHDYGEVWVNGVKRYAHRVAWELVHHRALAEGEFVCHTCDNPLCVRPDHLVVGTQADNGRHGGQRPLAEPVCRRRQPRRVTVTTPTRDHRTAGTQARSITDRPT